MGASIDLTSLNTALRTDIQLFSESNTRWIVELRNQHQQQFEQVLSKHNIPYYTIGKTGGSHVKIVDKNNVVVNQEVATLRKRWRSPIWDMMG